jgi:hypothetical protein
MICPPKTGPDVKLVFWEKLHREAGSWHEKGTHLNKSSDYSEKLKYSLPRV